MFALVDCNNFYASCERAFRPDLENKPIVILSNNDGCIVARSNEAKTLGIPMGMPVYKVEKMLKEKGVHVFSSNYPLYGDMSNRVMQLLTSFCPNIEIYSIDEAFLKFVGFENYDLKSYGDEIQRKVTKGTGIPISVGIAPTKALAKIANRIAKKYAKETKSVHVIDTEELRIKALKWIPIEDVWGIGKGNAKRLKAQGVKTGYDFTQLSDHWVRQSLSVIGLRLKRDLQGVPTLDLETESDKKMIATTRSFEKNYTDFEDLRERISTFASSCAEKLRQQKTCCHSISIFLRSNKHRKDLKQCRRSIVVRLPYASNSTIDLVKAAVQGLEKIFEKGYSYKKGGVIVSDFFPANQEQTMLFEDKSPKHQLLMEAMDNINKSVGVHKVKLSVQDLQRTWKMKQERLSPCYTTKLSDIITVKV